MSELFNNNHLLNAYFRLDINIIKAETVYLYDNTGKKYLDFGSGIAVNNLGHNNQYINQQLTSQINQIWHASNLFSNPLQQKLATRLAGISFADKIFFCSSGLEANETAIKIIRKYQYDQGKEDCYNIISFKKGFHGRSLANLSAGGNDYARRGFYPLLPGFTQIEANDIELLESHITPQTAGILIEPLQSEGGINHIDINYIKKLRKICDQHNILLCFDEVQTGYGRLGAMFAYQKIGVSPDIMTLAKGMGNGFPLAGCLTTERVGQTISAGTHGSTYGGNYLAMSVGNAVLDIFERENIIDNVQNQSKYLMQRLQELQSNFPHIIKEIRGEGLLLGMEVNNITATDLMQKLIHNGLVVTKAGNNNIIRILPPLIITHEHIDEALEIISQTLKSD